MQNKHWNKEDLDSDRQTYGCTDRTDRVIYSLNIISKYGETWLNIMLNITAKIIGSTPYFIICLEMTWILILKLESMQTMAKKSYFHHLINLLSYENALIYKTIFIDSKIMMYVWYVYIYIFLDAITKI